MFYFITKNPENSKILSLTTRQSAQQLSCASPQAPQMADFLAMISAKMPDLLR
jgi:hypothetical protein